MPRIFYCVHCNQFSHIEGYPFQVIKTKGDICIICKNRLRVFEVQFTNWNRFGRPIGMLIGIAFGITILYFFSIGLEIEKGIEYYSWLFIFPLISSILITIGVWGGLSLFDPITAVNKISKDHTELEQKRIKDRFERASQNHCIRCDRELVPKVEICPYCSSRQ